MYSKGIECDQKSGLLPKISGYQGLYLPYLFSQYRHHPFSQYHKKGLPSPGQAHARMKRTLLPILPVVWLEFGI